MGIVNSATGEERKYTADELREAVVELRAYDLLSIFAAGSGHPGGSLSILDIAAALYLNEVRHDPKNPDWPDRDRVFWSAGHKAPALYVCLAKCGYFPMEDLLTLRRLGSPLQGHPHCRKCPGVEISSGSLGQGLGVATGNALAVRLDGRPSRVYCIMGDGEQQEGNIWEAAMAAAQYGLDHLVGIVDCNRLQIDGWVREVMNVDPLARKYEAFGWHAIEIDGHDMDEILEAFAQARAVKGRPTVILAHTIKGKGVSYMENEAKWHGVAPKTREELDRGLKDIMGDRVWSREEVDRLLDIASKYDQRVRPRVEAVVPKLPRNYRWNSGPRMRVEMKPTRFGFGEAMAKIGSDPRIVTLHADISDSIRITDFEKADPSRRNRVFSVGIAEQNMMTVAAGLAREGKIPVAGTYGVFAAGRPWDQIRTTICYSNMNVKIAGAHGGISVGPDGATHQALEEIALMAILPNMHVLVPADAVETAKAAEAAILHVVGPAYVRYAREATPIVTKPDTPFVFGRANVIRYRAEADRFVDAFETVLAANYKSEGEDVTIIACGPMVPEAMRAAYLLQHEHGLQVRVLNMHTVKPMDEEAVARAVEETGLVVAAEEHQVGGFGNLVAGVAARRKNYATPLIMDMVGVEDRFGESGSPWDLMKTFHLCAEHIAAKVMGLLDRKRR